MNQEDREILITVKVDVKWLKAAMKTHFSQHFKIKILVWGSALAAIAAVFIACI